MSRKITFLSVMAMLCLIALFLASTISTNTIFFTLFSSIFIMLAVEEYGIKNGILTYAASLIISFLLVPSKTVSLSFILFFGYYPIIKCLIERLNKLFLEWVIKLALGTGMFFIIYEVFTSFIGGENIIRPALWIIILVAVVIFIIYDFALSLGLGFYKSRLRKLIIKNH